MQLYVKGPDDACTAHLVQPHDSVTHLKTLLQTSCGIPVEEQLLVTLGGRVLAGDGDSSSSSSSSSTSSSDAAVPSTRLCDAWPGLAHGATLQLLLRLRGGKGGFGALLRGQGRDGKITDDFGSCRDLSGRRVRHVEAEKKLKAWEKESKERELEKLALKHMKDMARQARRERNDSLVNVEEVKREHREAAERVAESVQTALAAGLNKQQQQAQQQPVRQGSSGGSSSGGSSGSEGTAAGLAAAAAAGAGGGGVKRKQGAAAAAGGAAAAAAAGSPAKKRKPTMLDMVEGSDSDSSDEEE